MKNVAFFGLGRMGLPIAVRLAEHGYRVTTTIHKSEEGPNALKNAGGFIAGSNAEAVRDAELIFSCVPDDNALFDLFLNDSMLASVPQGAVIIDMTSSSARAINKVAQVYQEKGVPVIDAPVSGGAERCRAGTMTMMCAGDKAVFDAVKPHLDVIAGNIFYFGALGNAKMVKLLNNLLGAIDRVATAEVIKIIEETGLDPHLTYDAIVASTGTSFHFQRCFKRFLARDYKPGFFTMGLLKKDVDLALDMAEGLYVPVSRLTKEIFQKAAPYEKEDTSAIMKLLEKNQ